MSFGSFRRLIRQQKMGYSLSLFTLLCLIFNFSYLSPIKEKTIPGTGIEFFQEILENIESVKFFEDNLDRPVAICDASPLKNLGSFIVANSVIKYTFFFKKVIPFLLSDIPPPFLPSV